MMRSVRSLLLAGVALASRADAAAPAAPVPASAPGSASAADAAPLVRVRLSGATADDFFNLWLPLLPERMSAGLGTGRDGAAVGRVNAAGAEKLGRAALSESGSEVVVIETGPYIKFIVA